MNLFDQDENNISEDKPLAYRMRPQNFTELFGQEKIVGEGKPLRRAIEADRLQSLILYGPPGTGKTSLARIIAERTEAEFVRINAVIAGIKDLREVIKRAENNLNLYNKKTILFIDEIHRFNKAQQDALLPAVEEGIVIMVGATTENPYFEVNSPLLSRSRIYKLEPLEKEDIVQIIKRALTDKERGLGEHELEIDDRILEFIAEQAGGDARTALNTLELAVLTTSPDKYGKIHIDQDVISESLQNKRINYDKDGDNHYDTVSALIKSMRGSDPDAALFWLAKMIDAGEDPRFIARRIIVHAAEDVGMADPHALLVARAAAGAVEFVGLPEARIPLAEAVVYIATAPKSNSIVEGIDDALAYVREHGAGSVPPHLRDSHYSGAGELGHGKGYKYPHSYPYNYVDQQYLPDGMKDVEFYRPGDHGQEKEIKKRLKFWDQLSSRQKKEDLKNEE